MKKNNKGFSLVELIIVIAIMAVLIGLLAPQYLRFVEKSKKAADVDNAQAMATAFNVAFADGLVSSSTVTLAAGDTNTSAKITAPEPKSTTGSWVVTMDEDGVKQITLGGKEIYPKPATEFAQ